MSEVAAMTAAALRPARDASTGAALHGRAHLRALPARDRAGGRRRRGRRRPVRHRDELRAGRALRPGGDPRGLDRRCGPTTRRSTSTCSRALSVVDWATSTSRRATPSAPPARSPPALEPVLAAGVVPLVLGGDHSIVLGELRAQAAVHGPLALVLLDAHADTWDSYYGERYFHGTPFRRAVEEGLLRARALAAGGHARTALLGRRPRRRARELGFELVAGDELRAHGRRRSTAPGARARRRRARLLQLRHRRDRPGVRARAPARPRWRASSRTRRSRLIRSLAGMRFSGFDVVEVSPPYDGPGQTTALLAAAIAYEFLALTALARRDAVSLPLHQQARLYLQKWRYYERNERSLAQAAAALALPAPRVVPAIPGERQPARGARRGPRGDRPLGADRARLLVRALSRDGAAADRRGHDPQPRLHARRDRADHDRQALHVRQLLLRRRRRPPLRRPGPAGHLAGNGPRRAR